MRLWKELTDKDIKTLVLDLRNNPGGYIYAAEKVADEFLEDDKLMLITRNKKWRGKPKLCHP